jgi:hypothetical protein
VIRLTVLALVVLAFLLGGCGDDGGKYQGPPAQAQAQAQAPTAG